MTLLSCRKTLRLVSASLRSTRDLSILQTAQRSSMALSRQVSVILKATSLTMCCRCISLPVQCCIIYIMQHQCLPLNGHRLLLDGPMDLSGIFPWHLILHMPASSMQRTLWLRKFECWLSLSKLATRLCVPASDNPSWVWIYLNIAGTPFCDE